MALLKPVVFDGVIQRQLAQGDIIGGGEYIPATNSGTAVTLTAALLAIGYYLGNPGGAATLTLDSAANLIAGLNTGLGTQSIQNGTTFKFRVILTTAQTATIAATANTGVTVNRGSVASNGTKDFLITINNGTPTQTFAANTTNANATLTGLTQAQCALLSVGMVVTNAVNGLQGTTITAINSAAGTVTMSGNANATSSSPVNVTFSPVVTVDGLAA